MKIAPHLLALIGLASIALASCTVYVPAPVVYRQPVYVPPQTVYVRPAPVYISPALIYVSPPLDAAPVSVYPAPAMLGFQFRYRSGPRYHW